MQNATCNGKPTPPLREGVPSHTGYLSGGPTLFVGSLGSVSLGGGFRALGLERDGSEPSPGDHGAQWAVGPSGLSHMPGSSGDPG